MLNFHLVPSHFSEGTNREAISILVDGMFRTNQTLCACARFDISGIELVASTISFLQFSSNTCRYEWNERENTRISRVQPRTPSSEAAWRKTNKTCLWETKQRMLRLQERRLQFSREARKRCEQSLGGLKKQTRKHRRDSKLNGSEVPEDVSVKQPHKSSEAAGSKRR